MGSCDQRCVSGADRGNRRLHCRRRSGQARTIAEPAGTQGRSHHPAILADCVRPRRQGRWTADGRGLRSAGARVRARPENGDDSGPGRSFVGARPALVDRDREAGETARRSDSRRRCGRRPGGTQSIPSARGGSGRLQRRQVPARTAVRRSPDRPQGSGAGGVDRQRSASWLRPRLQGRARRDHGHGRGRRDVDEAQSCRGAAYLERLARAHRRPPQGGARCDHGHPSAAGPLKPHAVSDRAMGQSAHSSDGRGRSSSCFGMANHASPSAAPARSCRFRPTWSPTSRSRRTSSRRARNGSSPSASSPSCQSLRAKSQRPPALLPTSPAGGMSS